VEPWVGISCCDADRETYINSTPPHRPIRVSCEKIDSNKPQSHLFTRTEFEEFISDGRYECDTCGEEMSAEGYRIECFLCDMEFEGYSLSQIPLLLEKRCGSCASSENGILEHPAHRLCPLVRREVVNSCTMSAISVTGA